MRMPRVTRTARVACLALFLAPTIAAAQATDLVSIAATGKPEEIRQALANGGKPNAQDAVGRTALMLAAAWNPDPQVIAMLVKAGASINARGPRGWTALMMAAYNNPNPDVVLALLDAGADARLRSDAGWTAFVYGQENDALKGSAALARLRAAAR